MRFNVEVDGLKIGTANNITYSTNLPSTDKGKITKQIAEIINKPKPRLANYLYKENGEVKTGSENVYPD